MYLLPPISLVVRFTICINEKIMKKIIKIPSKILDAHMCLNIYSILKNVFEHFYSNSLQRWSSSRYSQYRILSLLEHYDSKSTQETFNIMSQSLVIY